MAGARNADLRRTFSDWMWELWRPLVGDDPAQGRPKDLDSEDIAMSLVDRIAEWPKQYIEQGREQAMEH